MLQSMGSQRVRHDLGTKQQQVASRLCAWYEVGGDSLEGLNRSPVQSVLTLVSIRIEINCRTLSIRELESWCEAKKKKKLPQLC